MTDFIDNLLTSMSSKFNEQKEVGPINLSEDKTLKWRGLHNNQYAAVKKRRKLGNNNNTAADTPENGTQTAGEQAGEQAGECSSGDKIVAKETLPDVHVMDNANNVEENKTHRRTLRRKLVDEVPEDSAKRASRTKKQPAMAATAAAAAISSDAPVVMQSTVDKSIDDVNSADIKMPSRRSVRARKATNTSDQTIHPDQANASADQNKSSLKLKTDENVPSDTDTIIETQSMEQPKLRRSERTLHGSMSTETKDSTEMIEIKTEEIQPSSTVSIENSASESLKKFRKKAVEEKKQGVEEPKAIIENVDDLSLAAATPNTSQEIIAIISNKITIGDELVHQQDEDIKANLKVKSPSESITASDTEAKQMEIDNDLISVETSGSYSPKKRGRKPITKFLPKNDPKESPPIVTRSSKIKKSPRQISDESAFSYTLTKKDKSINEQVQPQQRLSRRIKPTPKILANEELRQGFELQNNARLSLSSENLDKDIDRSPKQGISSRRGSITRTENEPQSIAAPISEKEVAKPVSETMENIFPAPAASPPEELRIENIRPARPPCPDPEKFLNEIKMAKINLHRSPEDNKKLNLKQKKRLSKLKEKHLNKLGLQKANKTGHLQSSSDDADSDDADEFVPAKRINVGRPSVTLRVRGQKDIVIYDKHIMPRNKEKQHKKRQPTASSPSRPPAPVPVPTIPPMVSIAAAALRNPEISLIASTKHKTPQSNMAHASHKIANAIETNGASSSEVDKHICLCAKPSKYFTKKTAETFCAAIDQIETQTVGCCNKIEAALPNLLRPSVRVSYMVLCESHIRRLLSHNCCAGCGVFCTQGKFILCQQSHFFHRDCATKFILNAPYDPARPNYTSPTLVLKCPHCGIDAPEDESTVTMRCSAAPVFVPSQKNNPKLAKMSISIGNSNFDHSKNRDHAIMLNVEKIMPDYVVAILVRAQNNASFAQAHKFTTKDVFYAVNHNDIERMAEIIASGFDITTPLKEFHHGTCLHLVSNFGSTTMAYLILSRVTSAKFIDRLDKELRSAIMCAVVGGKNDILKLLIQCGANITLKGPDGMTALHLAAKTGNIAAIRLMLNSYRETASLFNLEKFLNTTDDGGWTSIVWASELGNSAMVSAFLNCSANPNICDAENNTALHWATLSENVETVMLLLQAGCNLSAQNVNGDTPLHIACRNDNTRIALLLLANGASLEVANNADEAPYDCIQDENAPCGRAIFFNLQIRSIAGYPKYTVVCQDISNGRELYPIKIVRKSNARSAKDNRQAEFEFNDQIIPDFKYITKTILFQNATQIDRRVSQMRICSCLDNCTTSNCQCSEISIQNWYTSEGRLNTDFNFQDPAMIFECNDVCGCNKLLCKNRVVQNGTKIPLQVYECDDKVKGLGVQALSKIPRGTFVAEYTGEILTDTEADRRTDDSYFFDLGASEHCIDANFYGNISRFFNHSCEANVVPIRVYYEHQDLRFPKIAFFARKDIEANEEITFDYGEKFWIVKYRTFTCHCGKASCRFSDNTISKTLEDYNQRNSAEN